MIQKKITQLFVVINKCKQKTKFENISVILYLQNDVSYLMRERVCQFWFGEDMVYTLNVCIKHIYEVNKLFDSGICNGLI